MAMICGTPTPATIRVVQMEPGSDADLDRIGARLHQRQRRRPRGDVAADDFDLGIVALDPAHALDHAFAVAVRRVNHDGVHAGLDQRGHALLGALAHAYRSAHAQSAGGVTRRIREIELLGNVLDGDQALEFEGVVDHQQTLQLVLVQQRLRFFGGGAIGHSDQALARRHDLAHRLVVAGLEAQVAPGDDADHLAAVADRESGHPKLLRQGHDLAHGGGRRDHHRVAQQAAFIALDLGHLRGLLGGRQVLVNDADAAFLSDGNRQARFSHGVHGRGDQGQLQFDIAGKPGGERGVLGQDLGECGHQQHIVEGERFS
jgi:hypothetical protein